MDRSKHRMRDRIRAARTCLHPPDLVARSRRIASHTQILLEDQKTVMVYASKPGEVDTMGMIRGFLDRGVRLVVPIIERETRSLRLSRLEDPAVLVPSTFGVPEPIGHELPVDPDEIGAVIVPMLGFDRFGNRLGYGAGYYDRFLGLHPIEVKVGIALACQEFERIPADPFDIPMDWIVTEDGPFRCSSPD
ncbi:MAG TPA: 5-formyltetrahydrofolate cyclo-ligase [Methanoregulaceae archaeon]|nr:5-formyltetrahydrofolate cyclo-ligase [Methanoregulaceae archaeon]HOV68025.1 5-formyltetrahydrofolate cyclo-ligase [Methanoregulaceae archaeon]HQJ87147.1 5-formyltetrahydrofolate cyclo-ligase [Methanoregulaceae archaeon]